VTGLTDDFETQGLVVREGDPADRRLWIVRQTPLRLSTFEAMAREHERWVVALFAHLDGRALQQLYRNPGALRVSRSPAAGASTRPDC